MEHMIELVATLGRLLIEFLSRLGLIALLGLALLGAVLAKWGSPTLAWVGVLCASLAVFAVQLYITSGTRLLHKILLVSCLITLSIPPLWIALSTDPVEEAAQP